MIQPDAPTVIGTPPQGVAASRRRARPLAAATGVIYISAVLLLLAYPQPVLDWLDDLEPNALVTGARTVVAGVAELSDALGLSSLSRAVRSRAIGVLKRPDETGR